MPVLSVYDLNKKSVGEIQLADAVFGAPVNVALVHQVVKAYLANQRQGTAMTKTKGLVRGGGRKPFKQKGTGNARQGSSRSPLNPGGGQTFGPQPRDYRQFTPKKMMAGALVSALSDRVKSERVLVLKDFDLDGIKTKKLNEIIKSKLGLNKALIIDEPNENLALSGRNIPSIKIDAPTHLNVYDVVKYDWLVLTEKAVKSIEARLSPRIQKVRRG